MRLLTEEGKSFTIKASGNLQCHGCICDQTIAILNEFFKEKFTSNRLELSFFQRKLNEIIVGKVKNKTKGKAQRIKQLNFLNLFDQYAVNPIVE